MFHGPGESINACRLRAQEEIFQKTSAVLKVSVTVIPVARAIMLIPL